MAEGKDVELAQVEDQSIAGSQNGKVEQNQTLQSLEDSEAYGRLL